MKAIQAQKLKSILLFIAGLSMVTTWLPLLRTVCDGNTYSWGTTFFGISFFGSGLTPDYFYVLANAAIGFSMLYGFYFMQNRKVFHSLAILWFAAIAGNSYFEVLLGEGYMFHGDTLNTHVDLSWVILPLTTLMLIAAILVVINDSKEAAIWHQRNTRWLFGVLAFVPVQALLFVTGEPHGTTDQIGVIIALVQVVLFYWVFKRYSAK
jgi:hypothetical protein